ncbi:MAG TPA: tetratricopeptide repeat protein [Candidatus Polarisedimenticolaceae bacterium]|nr:tetratricopeptide repeat protein [Candidatus Polarisedimenticolaceae bacterium]
MRGVALVTAVALSLALLVGALYAPACGFDYINFDDPLYVTDNPHVRQGLAAEGVRWAFNVGYAGNWHPLTWLSHMLDVELFGLAARAQHRTNVALHALNAALVFLLLRGLLRPARGAAALEATSAVWLPALVAGLFAVHPLRVESVAWISERKDVLGVSFWLLATLAYLRYARRPGPARYAWVVLALAAGLASKPVVVTLPLAFCLLDCWPLRRRALAEKLPLLALAAAAGLLTVLAQSREEAVAPLAAVSLGGRLANAATSGVAYLGSTLWPARLAPFYPFPLGGVPLGSAAAATALLVAVSVAAWRLRRTRPWLALGWAWYLLTLLPMIGIVQVGLHARADRYTHVPHLGLAIALLFELEAALGRPRLRLAVASAGALAAGLLAGTTRAYLATWSDSLSLFGRAAAVTSRNYVAELSLSLEYATRGQFAEAERLAAAAVRSNPDYYRAWDHLGLCQSELGRTDEAVHSIETALRLRPGYSWAYANLGSVELRAGRLDRAEQALHQALELDPTLAGAWTNLGLVHERRGRDAEAASAYRGALGADPELFEAHLHLGLLQLRLEQPGEAERELLRAESLRPLDPQVQLSLAAVELARGDLAAVTRRHQRLTRLDPQGAARLAREIRAADPGWSP